MDPDVYLTHLEIGPCRVSLFIWKSGHLVGGSK